MSTPVLAMPELVSAQALPETTVNEIARILEQGARWFVFIDRDLNTPPGSPADGDAYLVASSATGAWSGHDGDIAWRMSTAWEFIAPSEGMAAFVADEDAAIAFDGAAWVTIGGSSYTDADAREAIHAAPSTQSGTSYTAVLGDAYGYIQFTNAAAVAFTIPPNSSVAFAVGTVITVEQNGAGTITLTPDTGVTLNSRAALLDTAGQYAVAQLKKVATNTWTVIGDVA